MLPDEIPSIRTRRIRTANGSEAEKCAGLAAMAGRVIFGVLRPRELTAWAHGLIGHDGAEWGQPLVELEDRYLLAYVMAEDNGSQVDTKDLNTDVVGEARRPDRARRDLGLGLDLRSRDSGARPFSTATVWRVPARIS